MAITNWLNRHYSQLYLYERCCLDILYIIAWRDSSLRIMVSSFCLFELLVFVLETWIMLPVNHLTYYDQGGSSLSHEKENVSIRRQMWLKLESFQMNCRIKPKVMTSKKRSPSMSTSSSIVFKLVLSSVLIFRLKFGQGLEKVEKVGILTPILVHS